MNREKHKLPRRILALLLTLAMCVTMFPTAMFAEPGTDNVEQTPVTEEKWDTSKSKEATKLGANYESEITLSLPAAEETLTSDVVFVLDKSSCKQEVTTEALEMLQDLYTQASANDATIKVGAVQFAGQAIVSCQLTELTETAVQENGEIYEGLKTQKISDGTNLQAGLLKAQELLASDTSVDDNRKYVIVITDGLTRQFLSEDGTLMAVYNAIDADGQRVWASPTSWSIANGFGDGVYNIPGGNWDAYWNAVQTNVAQDGDAYAHEYKTYGTAPATGDAPATYISKGENSLSHALCLDRAIYEAEKVYRELAENYKCFAVFATTSNNNKLGEAFVDFLNDGKMLNFAEIQDDIYYLLGSGSKVIDEIGSGTDNEGNAYNFDFINDINKIKITVGGQELDKEQIEENHYGFGELSDNQYRYELTYYQEGYNGNAAECFVWEINENVSNFAPVQLMYSVKLTDPQKTPGTYGTFDAKGESSTEGRSLFTNNSATLYPFDSNGTEGEEEAFNKPSVSYIIEDTTPITITPADITIYTGGAGYGGVTDANGNIIQSTETTGLPEPGYHITLTESAVDWLSEQLGEDAGLTAQNLSEYLSFDYNNGGVTRHWDMEYVGIYDQDAYGQPTQYVYSLLPSKTEDPSEDLVPVRLMYWEDNDNDGEYDDGETVVNDDDIPMLANSVSKEYAMTINPGELDQGKIQATLKVNNNTKTFDVNIGTSTLTVKSTTNDETTTMIASNENDVNSSTIQAVGNNVTYYVNDSEVEINNDSNRVQLLVDEISNNDGFNTTMGNDAIDRVADQFAGSADLSYDTAYMDLVDTENGNAVVTMGDDDWLDLYWPAPNNAAADSKYYIVHYTDMNRLEITDDVAQAAAKEIEGKRVTIGENDYIKFNVTSFSPFVLVWEEKEPYVPPYNPGTGDNDDDEPPALNTEDHYLYIEGYPEDYRTGEYSDNEDLWPVKPQGNITRAEVATVFYRLLKDEVRDEVETDVNSFTDVNADDWFNITVSSLANMGIIAGYEDGSFRPNAPITRAEFAAIAARFFENNDVEYNEGLFEDITGDEWYADIVAAAVAHDLISGYPDGTMRPMANITRAEACAIVNRTIDRRPHDEHLCPVEEMRTWPDNQPGAWYYADMQEATNGHYYEWIDIDGSEFEEWTEVDKDYDWTKR